MSEKKGEMQWKQCFDRLPQLRYLVDGDVVARLLKAGRVVVLVPHHDADLVQDDRPHQLVGALDLHHDGHDVVWRLGGKKKKTEKRDELHSLKAPQPPCRVQRRAEAESG